jgi:hypothetical protein
MIIKQSDERTEDILALRRLLSRSDIAANQTKRVQKELIALRSGLKGEREAAYHIDFHYGAGENYAIIHDLRVEFEGRTAQIDHLIIGRFLQCFVCETKYWSDGVSINESGEFSAHYGERTIGVPSPIMQNARHIKVLSSVLASGLIDRPKRLGLNVPADLTPITLVSTRAKIKRPSGLNSQNYSEVIKADQLADRIQAHADTKTSALRLARLVSAEALREFATGIANLHTPIQFNYAAKFGFGPSRKQPMKALSFKQQSSLIEADSPQGADVPLEATDPVKRYQCAVCAGAVELKVARYCWFNRDRFKGEIRCRSHQ